MCKIVPKLNSETNISLAPGERVILFWKSTIYTDSPDNQKVGCKLISYA